MAGSSPWPTIHAERKALVADLEGLSAEQWKTQSMCSAWSVQELLGHMTATAKITPPKFLGAMIGSGFSFERMVAKDAARESAGSGADALSRFKAAMGNTSKPPGPIEAMLGEVIIHPEDIRRPLGIKHEYPTDDVRRVAEFYKNSNLIVGAKKRIAGLTLKATDTEWTTGTGPTVEGPVLSLVLAMTGRTPSLDDLSGEGVATLKSRM